MNDQVLVTGGSGFLAAHVIAALLKSGYPVRTTLRSLEKSELVRRMVRKGGVTDTDTLTFCEADLLRDDGWLDACRGCRYVLHVASPMAVAAADPEELIRPAVDGAVRVLKAARDAGVERVVFTSTCGAIYYGHPLRDAPFDETDWTNLDSDDMSAYVRSKALAERAVWDFIERKGGELELTVINPSGIFGPALGPDYSGSLDLIGNLLTGSLPACPDLWFGVVDVRDVADLHVRAMSAPEAAGERFIATQGGAVSMLAIARVLRERLGDGASRVPRYRLPNVVVRLMARTNPQMRGLLPLLGKVRNASADKAVRVFDWHPRSWEDAVVATAESLLELGVVQQKT